jgi:hypothetical protein
MNNQSYLWETPSKVLDPAFTMFYAEYGFLVDSILVVGVLVMLGAFLSIVYAPHVTYDLFTLSSFFMCVGMIMAFVNLGPAIMFMLFMLFSGYKGILEAEKRREVYIHAK